MQLENFFSRPVYLVSARDKHILYFFPSLFDQMQKMWQA